MAQERNDIEKVERVSGSDSVANEADYNLASGTGIPDESAETEHVEHLKGQIDQTRSQMGETIDAIQDKLSFSNLSKQVWEHVSNAVETAKDAVFDATIGKAAIIMKNIGSDLSSLPVVKTVKKNPYPFILIGLGAGLLAYQSYAGKTKSGHTRILDVAGRSPRPGESNSDTMVADKISNAAGTAYDKVSGAVETAYTGASEAVHRAYGKVGEFGTSVRKQYDTQIQEHPLAVSAVALALGAAVGMAIPATNYEGELIGTARQDLLGKAQATASELIDKAKDAVTDAGRNFGEQAKTVAHNLK